MGNNKSQNENENFTQKGFEQFLNKGRISDWFPIPQIRVINKWIFVPDHNSSEKINGKC